MSGKKYERMLDDYEDEQEQKCCFTCKIFLISFLLLAFAVSGAIFTLRSQSKIASKSWFLQQNVPITFSFVGTITFLIAASITTLAHLFNCCLRNKNCCYQCRRRQQPTRH